MGDHPERVYCPRCGCPTRAYVPGFIAGQAYQGNLTCAGCGQQYPGAEVQAAREGTLTYQERCRVAFIRWELEHGTRPDEAHEWELPEGVPV